MLKKLTKKAPRGTKMPLLDVELQQICLCRTVVTLKKTPVVQKHKRQANFCILIGLSHSIANKNGNPWCKKRQNFAVWLLAHMCKRASVASGVFIKMATRGAFLQQIFKVCNGKRAKNKTTCHTAQQIQKKLQLFSKWVLTLPSSDGKILQKVF